MGDLWRGLKGRVEQWVSEHPLATILVSGGTVGAVVGGILGSRNLALTKRLRTLRDSLKEATRESSPSSSGPSAGGSSSSSTSSTVAPSGSSSAPLASGLSSKGAPLPATNFDISYIDSKASPLDNFVAAFDVLLANLKAELPSFELPPHLQEYFVNMQRYNALGGKMNRGLSVEDTLVCIKKRSLMKKELAQCHVLGWCVELLQAFFLVADDIMDSSVTRRGQPCWYRLEGVGLIAVNDSLLIESTIYRLLRMYFGSHPKYTQLLDLFHEVCYQTEIGQLLDLTSASLNTSEFSMELHTKIVKYKTAFYSFYLPVALGMVLGGIEDPSLYSLAEDILVDIGVYFQVQDDFLDCHADPKLLGKIGTDIEDRKCSWVVIQALQLCSPAQKARLEEIYGEKDEELVQEVKALYRDLNIARVYHAYEDDEYARISAKIQKVDTLPQKIFSGFLDKIHKRQK